MQTPGSSDPYHLDADALARADISENVAREALLQAREMFADLMDVRKGYDSKALGLFGGFITVSLALFGVAGAALAGDLLLRWEPFGLAGAAYATGAVCFMCALWDKWYGHAGSHPDVWLRRGTIDGREGVLGRTLAQVASYYRERIELTLAANNRKKWWIRLGIAIGAGAPFLLALTFGVQSFF